MCVHKMSLKIPLYIYKYVCVCVCVCVRLRVYVCICVCMRDQTFFQAIHHLVRKEAVMKRWTRRRSRGCHGTVL